MAYEPPERVREILKNLPTGPGVYIHRDADGRILYIGKAVNLRSRVRSYFQKNVDSFKTVHLRQRIADVEVISTDSELEALLLEMTLIKKHRPHYNIRLKDDKRYPYIKVHWADSYPKVTVTRRMVRDGSRYFGPYTSAWAVHQTLDLLRRVFPYLTCDRNITGNDERACLYYDIKLCNAPCIGAVSKHEYRAMIAQLMDFLEGRSDGIIKDLERRMQQAAMDLDFEAAAQYRDQLHAIDKVVAKQKVIAAAGTDQDVIAFAREAGDACVQVFFIRHGKLIGREYFLLEGTDEASDAEVLQDFITQFYHEAAHIPKEVLLPNDVEEAQIIETWLKQKRGQKVAMRVPQRGKKRELVKMAAKNAQDTLATLRQQWASDRSRYVTAMDELQKALDLPSPPARIEGYDISHTQGRLTVGSMVVFVQGVPYKQDYRRFNIRSVTNDDYGAMREVLQRRFQRHQDSVSGELTDPAEIGRRKKETAWVLLPDLMLIDGGKGQLAVAQEVLAQFGLKDDVPVAALAKQEEELFVPGREQPIRLPSRSEGFYLVQRVRDESHRFANLGHRRRRSKVGTASILDGVPGVGPKRRKILLEHFGTLDELRKATAEEIASLPGIPYEVGVAVKSHLS